MLTAIANRELNVFLRIYTELENRIKIFTSFPFDSLDHFALERRVREIGTVKPPNDK